MKNDVSILVVDDNDHQHELIRVYSTLTPNIELHHVYTLEAAVEIISTHPIDGILLDNRLHPYEDFRETIPIIKSAGFAGPIAVISSDVRVPVFAEAARYGVAARLDKSEISLNNFGSIIENMLKTHA